MIEKGKLNEFVKEFIKKNEIVGCSVAVVSENYVNLEKSFGYSNEKSKTRVTDNTYFQLGSTSKAFTGLAVLWLEKKGLITLSDPVSRYIPWFYVKYKKERIDLTIKNLLHHCSGIPFDTIMYIPETTADYALEATVRTVSGRKLEFHPGEKFLYATINYDVLGYIIELVSGKKFEKFMEENILKSLGLDGIRVTSNLKDIERHASGYKYTFFKNRYYRAPVYCGNAPAGYFDSDIKNMTNWLKLQLHIGTNNEFEDIIANSHCVDRSFKIRNNIYYNAGWMIDSDRNVIAHQGKNPNFSTHVYLDLTNKIGVFVMINSATNLAQHLAEGIAGAIEGERKVTKYRDFMFWFDLGTSILCFILMALFVVKIYSIFTKPLMDIFFRLQNRIVNMILLVIGIGGITILSKSSKLLTSFNIRFLKVWGPGSLKWCIVLIIINIFIYSLC